MSVVEAGCGGRTFSKRVAWICPVVSVISCCETNHLQGSGLQPVTLWVGAREGLILQGLSLCHLGLARAAHLVLEDPRWPHPLTECWLWARSLTSPIAPLCTGPLILQGSFPPGGLLLQPESLDFFTPWLASQRESRSSKASQGLSCNIAECDFQQIP